MRLREGKVSMRPEREVRDVDAIRQVCVCVFDQHPDYF